MSDHDDALRARLRSLRADAERAGVPDFGAMMARARAQAEEAAAWTAPRRRWTLAAGGVSLAAAAALAGVLLTRADAAEDAEFERLVTAFTTDVSAGAWQAPTDRLLDVPGADLMRSVPSVGLDLPIAPSPRPDDPL